MSIKGIFAGLARWKNKTINAIKREWKSLKSMYVKKRRCKLLFDNFSEAEIRQLAAGWAKHSRLETKLDNVTMTAIIKDVAKTQDEIKFIRKVWGKQSRLKEKYYSIWLNE